MTPLRRRRRRRNRPLLSSRIRITTWLVVLSCAGYLVGCTDVVGDTERGNPASAVIVSDPTAGNPGSGPAAAAAARAGTEVYISFPPGTVPNGERATIENLRTLTTATVAVVDGGFDPVAVPAITGDSLRISVRTTGSTASVESIYLVPIRRRPVVVRTDPPPRKPDVPLNAIHLVVFSEPIDPQTVSGTTVQLRRGTQVIPGRLTFRDSARLYGEFLPATTLQAGTTYDLVITEGVRDLDGDPLEKEVVVQFTTTDLAGRIAFTGFRGNSSGIYVMDADGYGITQLVPDGNQPDWSPDGRRIVYIAQDGLSVINDDGSGAAKLADGGYSPSWSPDGGKIAFARNSDIYVMNNDGSGVTRLTDDPASDGEPDWSPSGAKIVFARRVGCQLPVCLQDIYVMNADGSGVTRLTTDPAPDDQPTWSPTGSKIAFTRQLGCGIAGGCESDIFVMNPDGSGVTKLTENPARDDSPAWSPDGSKIAYTTRYFGLFQIHVINADGSGERRITTDQPDKWALSWTARPARP